LYSLGGAARRGAGDVIGCGWHIFCGAVFQLGLTLGSIYGLIAIGYRMVYGISAW
jgi:hypothetical protein